MPRYYYRRRSLLGTFFRWWAAFAVMVLFFVGVQWVFLELLPKVLPFLFVGLLVVAVLWFVHRLR